MAKTNPNPAADLSNDMLSLVATRRTADPAPAPATPATPASAPAAPVETPAPTPEPTAEATPAPKPVAQVASAPVATPAPIEQPAENQQPKGKKEPAAPAGSADYAGLFLQPVRGRKPKAIYVTERLHAALANITQATPDGVGLSDLLINIINNHFEVHGPSIRQFLAAQEKLRKTDLPY